MNWVQPPTTRHETIHGGTTPASMRVMFVDRCTQFMSRIKEKQDQACHINLYGKWIITIYINGQQ
jgi:hypothetical protein